MVQVKGPVVRSPVLLPPVTSHQIENHYIYYFVFGGFLERFRQLKYCRLVLRNINTC